MIKEWATVVSWQNGVALVHCDVKASCSSCASRAGCGSRVLNKLGPQTSHTLSVPCEQPLSVRAKSRTGHCRKQPARVGGIGLYGAVSRFVRDGIDIPGAVCQRLCLALRGNFGRRWRVSGRSRSFAWLSLPAVVAAGYYQRRFTARFSPHRDAFLPAGSVISLALIFIYNSRKNSSFTPVMLAVRAFPGFVDVV